MDKSIFRYVWRFTKRHQLWLVLVTAVSLPFYYLSLDLPKTIINKAIGGSEFPVFFGIDYAARFDGTGGPMLGIELDQVSYLMVLSGLFLLLVLVNGGFKFYINVYKGKLGERMLRRLRYQLYERVLRFPLPHFKRTSQGELIPMITQEVEPLGGFIGDAFSAPAYQGGIMLTLLVFMFVQDPILGAAAIALYPIQGYAIPKLQRKVNLLAKERVRRVRKLSEKIGESVAGAPEIHANNLGRYKLAEMTNELGGIYTVRYEIYERKFFIKFLNNFLGQVTPFFFYSIGGYQVIQGNLTLGALVAVLAAYKDLSAPWKELLNYYQTKEDSRIKYEQVTEQFEPEGLLDPHLLTGEPEEDRPLDGDIVAANLAYAEDEGSPLLQGASFTLPARGHAAITGSGSGPDVLAHLLARLLRPTGGTLGIGGRDMADLGEAVTGRRIAFVGPTAYVFSGSIGTNLALGLQHAPLTEPTDSDAADRLHHALAAGNAADDFHAEWVDHRRAGCADPSELPHRMAEILVEVGLAADVYRLGLRGTIDPARRPDIAGRLLEARRALADRLAEQEAGSLVERFDAAAYNTNATVAENLLFGTPVGPTFDMEHIAEAPYVLRVLEATGLTGEMIAIGHKTAQTMVELFADLPPGHEFFERFSFIGADEIPEYQSLLARAERGLDTLGAEDRTLLLSLAFRLIPARHRFGFIDDALQDRVLAARRRFAEDLPRDLAGAVEFFDPERFNATATLQDNILFGRIVYGQAAAADTVRGLIYETLTALDLRAVVLEVGLDHQAGVGGSRLTATQRQRLAIGRALLRRPDLLILDEAAGALDGTSQEQLLERVRALRDGQGLIWVTNRTDLAERFPRVLVLDGPRLIEDRPGRQAGATQTDAGAGTAAPSAADDAEAATAAS